MSKKNTARLGIALAALVPLSILWWFWADLAAGNLANFIQGHAYWLLWMLPALALTGVIVRVSLSMGHPEEPPYASNWNRTPEERAQQAKVQADHEARVERHKANKKTYQLTVGVLGLLVTTLVVGMCVSFYTHGYDVRRVYSQSVTQTDKAAPEFQERAAYEVAVAQAPGNLENLRGEIVDTSFVPDENVFTSLVERPGFLQGYAGIQVQDVELTGQASATICEFDRDADARLGGNFGHRLERQIAHERRGLIISASDAYGLCDGDTPLVVVPVKDHKGWFPAIEVPAGVAVYNGSTGDIEFYDTVEKGQIPGPVFPLSVAAELRESTAALGGFWDYRKNRVGFQDTSRDDGDPNAGNNAEFVLSTTKDEAPAYATPLTLRGRSTAIVAVGVNPAGSVTAGELGTYTVHNLPESRKANSDVADRLKTDYSDLPDWASGMRIFEIVPTGNEWVASLGQEKNVAYRMRIQANGDSCLETADGTQIRCGRATGTNGNGPGVSLGQGGPTTPVELPSSPENITSLTDEELTQLQRQLNDEITRRLLAETTN